MLSLLKRHQPGSPALAVLYWVVLTLAALFVLFVLFLLLDRYLPGGGMF